MSLDYVETDLNRKISEGRISQDNASLIREYLFELKAQKRPSERSLIDWYKALIAWCDVFDYSGNIRGLYEAENRLDKRKLKQNTMRSYLYQIKRFLMWRHERGITIDTKKLSEIKLPPTDRKTKNLSNILSGAEVETLINTCWRIRDRALVSMLYEMGARPVELYNLRWGDVKSDDYGLAINTSEKTGVPRYLRLIASKSYMAAWKSEYPLPITDDAYVFVSLRTPHDPIGYQGMTDILKRILKKAGFQRKISLYDFRHSRITNLLKEKVSESVIKLSMWGSIDSDMLKTYAHLDNVHIDDVMLQHAGVKTRSERKGKKEFIPIQCARCGEISGPTVSFCPACGNSLHGEAGESKDEAMMALLRDPAVLHALAAEIEKMRGDGR